MPVAPGNATFERLKPLLIRGHPITDPLAVELAQFIDDDRALDVAELRAQKGDTWRAIAEDCGRAWGEDRDARQDIGAVLCGPASAYLGEGSGYLDERPDPPP